jgi:translation initiation factor 2 alpha subunit (eIF-2alpha)
LAFEQALRARIRGFQALDQVSSTHVIQASSLTCSEPESVFENVSVPEETLAALKAQIARRLTPKPVKVRADIQVTCFDYAGIEAIKDALRAGEACSTEEVPIQVKLVAPPLYVMTTTSTDKQQAIERMEAAVEKIGEVIQSKGGDLNIKMKVNGSVQLAKADSSAKSRFRFRRRRAQGAHGSLRASQH